MHSIDGKPSAGHGRRAIRVRGTVQGVGFRPVVYRIARSKQLTGFVQNDSEGVWIEIEGDEPSLEGFADTLRREAPPLARIGAIHVAAIPARGDGDFRVVASTSRPRTRACIPPDAAACEACVRELFDPRDRRFRYPFINCTDCGPRFTIVRDLPYDRANTTMDAFVMCALCRAEYEDPADRRYHAEPNACLACGPRVALVVNGERRVVDDSAIACAARLLRDGAILAIKGLGGYQLAVDAANEASVARLRTRKSRAHKPFALMARSLDVIERVARASAAARDALLSPARPVVLLPCAGDTMAPSVSPALREIGVMLPTTPLHHLLLGEGPALLVMTSGNRAGEPIAKDDDEAQVTLAGIADAVLCHDRTIHARADDSVVRIVGGAMQPVRRARGFAPESIALGAESPCVLAVGAQRKSTVCITRGAEAFLSQHIGDLESVDAQAFFEEVIAKLGRLLGIEPVAIAHDLHPEYASTSWALSAARGGVIRIAVQHHHAHVAACLAEHGHTETALGVAFDGTGCGPAGDLWGGEILLASLAGFRRLGHLRPIALAGGEGAIREPWRLGVAALRDAGEPLDPFAHIDHARRDTVVRMIERGVASPTATGAGRWFDAVAAILGVRDAVTYDGQAAMELEALASPVGDAPAYPFDVEAPAAAHLPFVFDLRPMVRGLAADLRRAEPLSLVAARFHATLADVVLDACRRARRRHSTRTVALSGGCFQNRVLTERTQMLLERDGFEVLVHRRVPPNDGGVALGQAAIAAFRLRHDEIDGDARKDGMARTREERRDVPRHSG